MPHRMRCRQLLSLWVAVAALVVCLGEAASYLNAALPKTKAVPPRGATAPAAALEPVAIVGTGNMGSAIAELLCAGGVPLQLVSRSPQKAQTKARAVMTKASSRCHITGAASPKKALQSAGIVVLTLPFKGTEAWLRANRDAIVGRADRVIVDISNVWRSGEGIAADAAVRSGVELHRQALAHEGTQFVAAFKNNFAMRGLAHATGKSIVEFATDNTGDARSRFETLLRATRLQPVFRGEISKGVAATLEAEAGPFRPDLKAKHAQFAAAVRRSALGEL